MDVQALNRVLKQSTLTLIPIDEYEFHPYFNENAKPGQ